MPEVEHVIEPHVVCQRAFELIRDKQFGDAERLLSNCLGKTDDPVAVGLYHSTFGVLEKMRGDFKAALKHYERAEKLIPDDPILKLISARLLIDQYQEYGKALRKTRKVIKLLPDNPVVAHHARILEGLAYGHQGKGRKALECLDASIIGDFQDFVTARNIDFNLVELCVKRGWGLDHCQRFLEKALTFAEQTSEHDWAEKIRKIVEAMP